MATHQQTEDVLYERAKAWVREHDEIAVGQLQAAMRTSYNGAQAFMTMLEQDGILGPMQPDGRRTVIK